MTAMNFLSLSLLALEVAICRADEEPSLFGHMNHKTATQIKPCHENGVVNSWCDASIDSKLECLIDLESNLYGCRCEHDLAACPTECIDAGDTSKDESSVNHVTRTIECHGIPQDEPNFILRQGELPLHHCENNAIVAAWCNEWTLPDVSCLLLNSLDEYICSCHNDPAVCPQECIGGTAPDKKTPHGIRCLGIPEDRPNYVLGKGVTSAK